MRKHLILWSPIDDPTSITYLFTKPIRQITGLESADEARPDHPDERALTVSEAPSQLHKLVRVHGSEAPKADVDHGARRLRVQPVEAPAVLLQLVQATFDRWRELVERTDGEHGDGHVLADLVEVNRLEGFEGVDYEAAGLPCSINGVPEQAGEVSKAARFDALQFFHTERWQHVDWVIPVLLCRGKKR
jgi:hypothetical protein